MLKEGQDKMMAEMRLTVEREVIARYEAAREVEALAAAALREQAEQVLRKSVHFRIYQSDFCYLQKRRKRNCLCH